MPSALDDALATLAELIEAHDTTSDDGGGEGTGNFRCEDCVACHDCRFCSDCDNCRDCTYCIGCRDSLALTQCRQCDSSEQLSHSDWNVDCVRSSYITLCMDCEDCVQCFGCVGMRNAEFCILNEKLPRKEYFAKAKELRDALAERIASGWRPPWRDEADEADEAAESEDVADAVPIAIPEPMGADVVMSQISDTTQPIRLDPLFLATSQMMEDRPTEPRFDAMEYERRRPRREGSSRRPTEPALRAVEPRTRQDQGLTDLRGHTVLSPLTEEDSWRGDLAAIEAELPPLDSEDSGVYGAQVFDDIPPPPPYRPRTDARAEPEESPTQLHAPADDAPTLTRGSRPAGRRPASAPASKRGSLRRAKRPERK